MRFWVSGLIRGRGKMFEVRKSPTRQTSCEQGFPCATLCLSVLPVVQAFFAGHRMLISALLATVKCPRSVSLPLIHDGQQRPPSKIAPQIFGEQRVVPLP